MKLDLIEGSETSAIINQTPGNYPKENLLYPESFSGFYIAQETIEGLSQFSSRPLLLLLNNHRFYLVRANGNCSWTNCK